MKRYFYLLFFFIFLNNQAYAQTYIENVTLVDVVNKKLVSNQTVVIKQNLIADIQSSSVIKVPKNATIIDGKGKFLIPGMTDSHVHFFQSGGLYTRPDALDLRKHVPYDQEIDWTHRHMEDFLLRYLRSGITSVIDAGATYNFLSLRDSLSKNKSLPSVYMTGPLITTYEPEVFKNLEKDEPFQLVTSIEEAKKLVQKQLPYHPDFIKIWYIVTSKDKEIESSAKKYEPIVKAIIDEAHKNHLKVAVHATERITAQIAVQNGTDFLVHNIEDEIVPDHFIKLLKSKKVVLSPTLTVMDNYYSTYAQKNNYNTYELNHSNPEALGSIYDVKHLSNSSDSLMLNKLKKRLSLPQINAYTRKKDSIRGVNLKRLSDGDVTIAAGTDAGNIGTQHATSFITELKAMKEIGMSNWEVLQSATINPARIFNKEHSSGSIAKGKIADLVLLHSNPVDQLEHLTDINMVFKNGHPIQPEAIIKSTPAMLVQQQVNGYNARNVDAFLQPYAEDVELYIFPNKLLSKGKNTARKTYHDMFQKLPNLHCEIKNRIVNGNFVIDQERITGLSDGGTMEATAIYEIKDQKISKVYFLR